MIKRKIWTEFFDRADEISVKVDDIPEVAPDLAAVKSFQKGSVPMLFRTECNPYVPDGRYRVYGTAREKTERTESYRQLFDLLGVKYTGSDYLSSAIAMNKGMAKQLFAKCGNSCTERHCHEKRES